MNEVEMQREPNVFLFHINGAAGVSALELEQALLARATTLAVAARPTLNPMLLSHRILRGASGGHAWEIAFEGADALDAGEEPSLGEALLAEVRASVAGVGEVESCVAYTDLTIPTPGPGFARGQVGEVGVSFADDDLPGWEDYAFDSGTADAGTDVDADVLGEIARVRAAVPVEPGLKPWGSGHMYGGGDPSHRAYLNGYLDGRAARASAADRRRILAFRAFQSREGSTAAINTYDNQIVTWGTGFGGLGGLGKVMDRAVTNENVREALGRSGLRYRGKNVYDVVDLDTKRVATGQKDALQIVKRSLPLLYLLIFIARDPSTRDAVTEAQLQAFMQGSANIPGSDAIATQALFNLVVHLKHWAPGYVSGCMEWATPQAGDGPPSEDRDRRLATLIGRYFYGKARKTKWIPDWKQFQLYWKHMKEDGLDCLSDPFIQASAPPAEDPFAAPPPPVATPLLKNPPLAGEPELEAVAAGKGVLRKGAKGAGVKALQEAMIALDMDVPGGADGVFGPNLERAVMAYQQKQHLAADGVVGRKTLEALDACLGAAAAS